MTTWIYENVKPNQGLIWEANELFRETMQFDTSNTGSNAPIAPMTIVGKRTLGAISATVTQVVGANKGQIAMAATPVTAGAAVGVYELACIKADGGAGNPAEFEINGPHDYHDVFVAGTNYVGAVNFAKPQGAGDAVGDKALIVVAEAAGDGMVVPLNANPAAPDGSGVPIGIANRGVAAAAAAGSKSTVIVQDAIVQDGNLTYPAGLNAQQIAAVNAALRALDIKIIAGTAMVA